MRSPSGSPICAAALVPAFAGILFALLLVTGSANGAAAPSCPVGVAFNPCADLVAGRFTGKVIEDGRRLELAGTVTNAGTANAPATTLQVTIGTDALPEEQLPALTVKETADLTLIEQIPVDVRGTGQPITVTVDPGNNVAETSKTNNVAKTKAFFPALPDLTLAQPTLHVENGNAIVVDLTVLNQGTADDKIPTTLAATAAGATRTESVPALAKGASQSVTVRLVVPAQARVGPIGVTLWIDKANVLAEQDEDNNTLAPPPVTIAPDLTLARVTPTTSARSVTLKVTVKNTGNTAAPPTQVQATSPGWQPTARRIDTLAAGASTQTTLSPVAPRSAQGHDARITVTVDAVPGEAKDNNTRQVPVHIAAPSAAPDLFVASVHWSRSGRVLTLTVEVGNGGGSQADATRVHASAPRWNPAAASLTPLSAGGSTSIPLPLTIPASARGQRVEFLVVVDPVTGDSSGNNVKRVELKIPTPASAPPDIAVSTLRARRDGQEVIVGAVVANVGAAPARMIRLELRAKGWPPRVRMLAALAANQAKPVEFALRVPSGAAGTTADFRLRVVPVPGERQLANNRTTVALTIPSPHYWWPYAAAALGALLSLFLGVALTLRGRRVRVRLLWQDEADGERPETCEVPQSHVLQGEGKPKPAFRSIEKLGLSIRDDDGEEERISIDGAIVETLNRALWAHRLRRRRRVRTLVEPLGERLAAEIERVLAEKDDVDVAVNAEIKGGKLECEFTRSECVRDGDACRWEERQKWKGEVEDNAEEPVAAVHVPLEPRSDRVRQLSADLVAVIGRVDVPRRVRAPEGVPVPRD